MPDLDTELVRFGQWLDAEIDQELDHLPSAAALAGMPDRLGRRRSARLTTLVVGVAAVIVAGLIGLANRRPPSPAGPPPSGEQTSSAAAQTSSAAPNSAAPVTQSVTSAAEKDGAATTTTLDPSALGTAPSGTTTRGNRLPVARDDVATTTLDTPVIIAVLANDSDADGQTLRVVAVGRGDANAASIGGLEPGSNGVIRFTPAEGFLGRTSFTYTIEDTAGGRATATVEVTVVPLRSAALHLVPSDATGLTMPYSIERGALTLGPAVVVGRPNGGGDFTDVWWIDVGGQRPLPFDLNSGDHPEGRSGGGSNAWINEHGTLVRLEAAPHTEVSSAPCPQDASMCALAGSTLDQLLQRIVIDDAGQVTWTLPDGMVEIARTTHEITSEPMIWTGDGLSIIVDDQAAVADFIAARPDDLKRARVRGHDGWLVASYPLGPDRERRAGVVWEERPGVVASVFGVATDERLLAAAEDLRVATDSEWADLVAGARRALSGGYVVVPGDYLLGIAKKLGVSYEDLLAANPGADSYLVPGQTIKVPTR